MKSYKDIVESLEKPKTIKVTTKNGGNFDGLIKVTGSDYHIVKHPVTGKQYRVDKSGNSIEEEVELSEADVIARSDYKIGPSGRKSHRHIVFQGTGDDDDEEEKKKEVKEGVELEEAIEVSHDRYLRSHGKKASGRGQWMFTHKSSGSVDYNKDNEVHRATGSYSDAKKSAQLWAKKHGHSKAYVMEQTEGENMNEAKLSDDEMKKREDIVKGMKKNIQGFKARYGERAKEVMYATATKLAQEEVELDENAPVAPSIGVHRIQVTVSDPNHPAVSQRKEKVQKFVRVTSNDKEKAVEQGKKHFSKKGWKVHSAEHVGMIHEETINEESGAYEKAEENKRSAADAKKQGDNFAYHLHMADHHDNMAEWHASRGRHSESDRHAAKAEEHHEKAMTFKESVELEESMADSWKKIQSMDKGSLTGGKEEARKRLAYLNAVHAHHKKYGNDTKKVKSDIENLNRSHIAEDLEEGYVVRYNNPKSEKHGSEKHFADQAAAQKHADRGNSIDKIGGKYTVHKTNEKGHDVNEEVELDEAVESGNKGYGYHGQHPSETADKEYSKAHAIVKKVAGEAGHLRDAKKPNVMVKHYLDSRHGRHLANVGTHDHEYIKKDFGKFKKSYNPELHEGVNFDEEGNLMADKKTYAQFVEQLLEYTPGPGGVTRVQGRSYGAQYHDPEGDDDADDRPAKKTEPAVKRGRGRPAGAKSGANQKVTSGKSYGGIATHSLHLPNTNR